MARKVFEQHEAVSAVVPGPQGYAAAIAVKALHGGGAPQFHKVLNGQAFKTAHDADQAAAQRLEQLAGVSEAGELQFSAT